MYCKMCGKMIDDSDRHCRFCGAPTGYIETDKSTAETAESTEEVVFNPPFKRDDELNESLHLTEEEILEQQKPEENLKEFISDNEIKEQQKLEEKTEEQGGVKNSEFIWNIHEFPKTKKTEEVEFNWKMDEFGQPVQQKEVAVAAFEEELFKEIREDASRIRESNIDRFFTFSRKNEEFQELLDKEYEKFNKRTGVPDKEYTANALHKTEKKNSSAKEEPEEVPAGAGIHNETTEEHEKAAHMNQTEDEPDEAESQNKETESDMAGLQEIAASESVMAETEKEITYEPIETETQETIAIEPVVAEDQKPIKAEDILPGTEETSLKTSKAEHLAEMEQARAMFFGEELVKDNETIIKKLSTGDAHADDEASLQTEHNQEEAEEQDTALQPEIAEEPAAKTDKAAQIEALLKTEETLQNGMILKSGEPVQTDQTAEEPSPSKLPGDTMSEIGENIEPEKEQKNKNANRAGTIVLTVIAVILVAEIAILGIRLIAPGSGAAEAINKAQNSAAGTISETVDRISNLFSGKDSTDKPKQKDQTKIDQQKEDNPVEEQPQKPEQNKTAPDPAPMSDKDALVASQIGNNVNIQQVKANTSLAYQEGRDYGLKDINQSKPIENNIWMTTDGGETTYYDKSVVGTVIAFDSQWIDYVNRGSKGALNLIKKDSPAYKKTISFSKAGKISENFRILEIGEIRQGSKGFYVWVHEEIQITEKGSTKSQKYNWIYYLEPVDGKMNIVNYFKFK